MRYGVQMHRDARGQGYRPTALPPYRLTARRDSATMWPLGDLYELVERAVEVWEAAQGTRERV
jgi:hypothetical protein